MLITQNPLTLSCYPSLSNIALGKFSRRHTVSVQSWWMQIFDSWPIEVYQCAGVQENSTYEFILSSSALPSISCSFYLSGLCDGIYGHTAAVLYRAAVWISSKQHAASLSSSYLAFSPKLFIKIPSSATIQ